VTYDELAAIRVMINDQVEPYKHTNEHIETVYDAFGHNKTQTAYIFILGDSLSMEEPIVPEEPVLVEAPVFLSSLLMEKWREDNQIALSVWQNRLTAYRAEVDVYQGKLNTLQQLARLYSDSGKGRVV
jgi:hypothetical protein